MGYLNIYYLNLAIKALIDNYQSMKKFIIIKVH